jgi:hypothetical protein
MPRKHRPLDRPDLNRDASLIVIASEDKYAVKEYFSLSLFETTRVKVHVLETEEGCSAPAAVVARLDAFRKMYATYEGDEFWLCIDTDHWAEPSHIANLKQVLQLCRQKDYKVAISNPCFELWLLLHFEDLVATDQLTARELESRLKKLPGGYPSKSCARLPFDETSVKAAVARAQSLDVGDSLIPDTMLTHVYKIIRTLQAKGAFN